MPERPNNCIAKAARLLWSSTWASASASSLNCSSGDNPLSCSTVSPRSLSASVAVDSPRPASLIVRSITRMPFSSVARSAPDCSAANPSSLSASTLTPVRRLILSSRSPAEANSFVAAVSGPSTAAPIPVIRSPSNRTPLPNARNRRWIRLSAAVSRSLTPSSTNARPARMPRVLAMAQLPFTLFFQTLGRFGASLSSAGFM